MKIKKLETYTRDEASIVKVVTDNGKEGIGQTSPYNADITAEVFHRQVVPHVLGKDPLQIENLVEEVLEKEYKFPGSYMCRAVCGLDTALWDLKGKLEGKSVCELVGGTPEDIRVYGSSMRRDISPAEEASRLKKLRDEYGYKAFKIRIGSVCGHNKDQWPGRTEKIVPTVREALGENIELLVDANSCYTSEKAVEVGKMLEGNNVFHFEEPCPYWKIDWTAKVTKSLDSYELMVAGGEQDNSIEQWKRIVKRNVVNIAQPDICYLGGFSRAYKVAQMAAEEDLICIPHSANLSLVTVFTMHLLNSIPNAGPFMEYSIEETPWVDGLFQPQLKVEDGKAAFPEGPGWGVEINPEWLAKTDYRISE
ncbi:MAG: mandelate racemase/muconate lactonizing enzyme family protein [Bacillota bacterium]